LIVSNLNKEENRDLDTDLHDKLVTFLRKELMIREEILHGSIRIEADLGVTGDDAVELVLAFGKAFQVDVTEFRINEYFGPEGTDIFCLYPDAKSRKNLTIDDLERAVLDGRLV
jgi:hypothetical protein